MKTLVRVLGLVVLLAAPAVVEAGPAIDPRQMSGIPRPDPAVPSGAITVRVLKGGFDRPAVDTAVTLEIVAPDGKTSEQTATTNAEGRAGFSGYVARDASIDALCQALADVVAGRLACPPEISGGLLRALFRRDARSEEQGIDHGLTRRESEVLQLLGRGLSNKEIAHELCLSVATIKHHVHHILEKLQLPRRAQAMRRVREAPWIAPTTSQIGSK